MLRKILIAGVLLAIAGGSYGYYMWNKKTPSTASRTAEITISANELASKFDKDKFAGKLLEVKGKVSGVETADSTVNITLETEDPMVSISCELEKGAATPSVKESNEATIRGECDGKLTDVVLTRCIIVK
jgi:tRNA_anti-like